MSTDLTSAAEEFAAEVVALTAIDLTAAQELMSQFWREVNDAGRTAVSLALSRTVRLNSAEVLVGPGAEVWANPLRRDFAWRCGACPWTGSKYRTASGALRAAERHATEHPGVTARLRH